MDSPGSPDPGRQNSSAGNHDQQGTTNRLTILVVEDDPSIHEPLAAGLERDGHDVLVATTGAAALRAGPVDLVLLDLGLPDIDGTTVCRQLREAGPTPIIVISARSQELDRVALLDVGADDYLVKPFGFRELTARIRAVLRRTSPQPETEQPVQVGDLHIDRRRHDLTFRGRPVALTPKEFALVDLLASDPGALFTREEILRTVWDDNWYGSTKTLDVHVASIRKKLDPEVIVTVRGLGFRLDPAATEPG